MNFVMKQFLMDCNLEIEYTNYLEILPEEIITIIYRFVNDDNIKKLGFNNLPSYKELTLQQTWTPDQPSFLPYAEYSYRSSNYHNTLPHQTGFTAYPAHYTALPPHHRKNINLHQLKMLIMGGNYRREYTKMIYDGGFNRDFIQIYKIFDRYRYVDGFCFELIEIDTLSSIYQDKFQFTLSYHNHNVGVLKIKSRDYRKKATNKNANVIFQSADDLLKLDLIIKHPQYYNDYKEPKRGIKGVESQRPAWLAPPSAPNQIIFGG